MEQLAKKFSEYQKVLKKFISKHKNKIEQIHDLRIKSRELYSIINRQEPFAKDLKQVIKLSNKIRDIDIFHSHFLKKLPKKYFQLLPKELIFEELKRIRDEDLEVFYTYLKQLSFPQKLTMMKQTTDDAKNFQRNFEYEKKSLHKYRIYIKELLYQEKNSHTKNKKRMELLTQIKDILGEMNDNFNALEILKSFTLKQELLQQLETYVEDTNRRLYEKFEKKIDLYSS